MNLSNATIGQLLIPVDDLDRAVPFYRDVLGLQFIFSAPPQMAFFQCGDVRLLVGVPPVGHGAQRGSTIYFQVADIGSVFASLNEKGVKFRAVPHIVHRTPDSGLWLAEFTDLDGNQLALMSQTTSAAA